RVRPSGLPPRHRAASSTEQAALLEITDPRCWNSAPLSRDRRGRLSYKRYTGLPAMRIAFALFLVVIFATAGERRLDIPLGLDSFMPVPDANPLTAEKAALGRGLFSDCRLYRDLQRSLATCLVW